jgi:hypothetical protein
VFHLHRTVLTAAAACMLVVPTAAFADASPTASAVAVAVADAATTAGVAPATGALAVSDTAAGVSTSLEGGAVKMTLPGADVTSSSTAATVASGPGNSHTALQAVGPDSQRATVLIAGAADPSEYRFAFSGASSVEVQPDGTVFIVDSATGQTSTLAAPWARDANGTPVPTHYDVRGSTVVQVVDHSSSSIAYPVSADPWWGLRFYLSNTSAQRLAAALAGGASASAIVAGVCSASIVGLPCGAIASITGGLIGMGSAAVWYCSAPGRGIVVNRTWWGTTWCTSR